jgi:PAS domain S-box-containing protein
MIMCRKIDDKLKTMFMNIVLISYLLLLCSNLNCQTIGNGVKNSEKGIVLEEPQVKIVEPLSLPQLLFNKMIKFFYLANGLFFSHFICFVLTGLIFLMVNSERKRTKETYYLYISLGFSLLTFQEFLLSAVYGIEVIKKASSSDSHLNFFDNFPEQVPFVPLLDNIPEQIAIILLTVAFLHQVIKDKYKLRQAMTYSLLLFVFLYVCISTDYITSFHMNKVEFNQHWGDFTLKVIDSLLLLTIMITIINSKRHAKYFLLTSYSLWFLSKYIHLYSTIILGSATRYFLVLENTIPIIVFIMLTMALYRHIAKENVDLEKAILASKDMLQAIFDGITDGILIIDKDYTILNFNNSEKFILEKDVEEICGMKCYIAYHRGMEPCPDCPATQTFRTGKVNMYSYTGARKPAGKKIHYDVYSFPIKDEHKKVTQVIVYIKDVTETKNMIDKMIDLDRLAMIGEMSARVAHEIRNPLDAISGSAAYLSKTIESDIVTEFTSIIMEETDRLFNLTSNLLTFAKPMPTNFKVNDINEIIKDTFKVLRAEIEEAGIKTNFVLYEDLPEFNFDVSQIKQALMNLIINAVESMTGGGNLTVKTYISTIDYLDSDASSYRRRLSKQEYFLLNHESSATICITDTGKGIEKDNLDKLFKPFFTTKAKGSGLGLAITERIIKNHYGKIEINSKMNEGSTFTIYLPMQ